jgi:hypothetical protein
MVIDAENKPSRRAVVAAAGLTAALPVSGAASAGP